MAGTFPSVEYRDDRESASKSTRIAKIDFGEDENGNPTLTVAQLSDLPIDSLVKNYQRAKRSIDTLKGYLAILDSTIHCAVPGFKLADKVAREIAKVSMTKEQIDEIAKKRLQNKQDRTDFLRAIAYNKLLQQRIKSLLENTLAEINTIS